MKYDKPEISYVGEITLAIQGTNAKSPSSIAESIHSPDRMTLPAYEADE